MRVSLLYFGVLKDMLARDGAAMELSEGETVGGLLLLLQKDASNERVGESTIWTALAVGVNREYAGRQTVLRDGDEVALLPPVSGGSKEATE